MSELVCGTNHFVNQRLFIINKVKHANIFLVIQSMSTSDSIAIEVVNLVKKFDDFTAVDKINFRIRKGEIFGLLGPNGAGKTTTMKMLIGLTNSTDGEVKSFGREITSFFDARDLMTIVFQEPLVWDTLTVRENIEFMIDIYDLDRKQANEMMKELLEKLGLAKFENRLAKDLSGGMRQKLSLIMSIITGRPILFLDEPTTGLDPLARKEMWDYILELKKEGITIVLSTHYMDEADYLCDRIAIMDSGKIIALGTPDELKEQYGGTESITLTIDSDLDKAIEEIKSKFNCKVVLVPNDYEKVVRIYISNAIERLTELINFINSAGVGVDKIAVSKPTLSDVFINLTGRKLNNE